jgi:hypothetical protein
MSWHVDHATAERYAQRELDATSSASVEAHLLACGECRATLGAVAQDPVLDELWTAIVDTISRPQLGWIERFLLALGVSEASARIVAATSRARWSYLLAVALSLLLAVLAWRSDRAELFGAFLVLAPLGPLVATATAFGRWSDPVYELVATVPTSAIRLLLVRTAAAVTPAIVLTSISLPWVADRGWLAVAWLLPALALALGALALSSWMAIEPAAIALASVWVAAPLVLRLDVGDLLDLLGGPVQLASLIAAACAGTVTVLRRSAYDYREL